MFIEGRSWYNSDGEQFARGRFLLLMQPEAPEDMEPAERVHYTTEAPIRVLVRDISMRQLGHFMMGTIRVGKHRIVVSGSYGQDGLPKTVPQEAYDKGVEVPPDMVEAWNKGGGWNSAGSEGPAMRAWALKTFTKKPSRKRA